VDERLERGGGLRVGVETTIHEISQNDFAFEQFRRKPLCGPATVELDAGKRTRRSQLEIFVGFCLPLVDILNVDLVVFGVVVVDLGERLVPTNLCAPDSGGGLDTPEVECSEKRLRDIDRVGRKT